MLRLVFGALGVIVLYEYDHSRISNNGSWWYIVLLVILLAVLFGFFYWVIEVAPRKRRDATSPEKSGESEN